MTIGGDLVFRILADKAQFDRTAQKTRGSIGQLAGFAKRAFAGIAVAYGGAFSVDAADQQAQSEKKLAAVLKATGNAAGFTAKEIRDLAAERQNLTNFGDEDTINLAGILATFKQIQGSVFKETITLAQDMSAVLGQDLKSSAIQLGKALNDPKVGITALSRAGVTFNENQKEMIRTMIESGDILGAQGVILAELRSEFGGSAEAMASSWQQLKNELGDTAEFVGAVLMPAVSLLNVSMGFVNDSIGAVIQVTKEFLRIGEESPRKMKIAHKDLREEFEKQADSLKNIAELTRLIDRNRSLQVRGQQLKSSGARGEGEFSELMDIMNSDLGKDRIKLVSELGRELDKLANPTSRFSEEVQNLHDTLRLLKGAEGLPGVETAAKNVKKLIDDQTGITGAIKEARREFDYLSKGGFSDIDKTIQEFGLAGASTESTKELAELLTKNKEMKENQARIADLKSGADSLKESLDPLISFNKRTGRIEEMFDEKLLDEEQFSKALAQAQKDFEDSVRVDPVFTDQGARGSGPSSAIAAGTEQFNQLIATALTGRDDEQKKQTKNLQAVRESNEFISASNERIEQLLRKNRVITKPDEV